MKVLQCLLAIEEAMGRERLQRGGPRIMDLDLLFYGSTIIDPRKSPGLAQRTFEPSPIKGGGEPNLIVPHPRLHLRRFVLVPLSELTPDLVHPVLGKTVAELLAVVPDKSVVRLYRW